MLFDKIIPSPESLYIFHFFKIFFYLLQVWWAASDLGWVVGHSYICYGPLLHGNGTILYEVCPWKGLISKINYSSIANGKKYQNVQ